MQLLTQSTPPPPPNSSPLSQDNSPSIKKQEYGPDLFLQRLETWRLSPQPQTLFVHHIGSCGYMIVYWLQQWCYSTTLSPLCLPPPPLTLFLPFMLFPLLSLLLSFLLPTSLPSFSLSYPHLFLSSLSPTPLPFPPLFLSPSFPHPSLFTFPDVPPGGMVTVEEVVIAVFGNVHSPSPVLQNLLNLIGHMKGSNRLYGCHMKGSSHRAVKKCWYVLKL